MRDRMGPVTLIFQRVKSSRTRSRKINHYRCFCGHELTESGMVSHLEDVHGYTHRMSLEAIREERERFYAQQKKLKDWGLE